MYSSTAASGRRGCCCSSAPRTPRVLVAHPSRRPAPTSARRRPGRSRTPSICSIRARVRMTAVCLSALIRCVVSQLTKPSAFGGLTSGSVVGEADRLAVVVDADEQRPAVGVEEPGDRLHDRVLHPLVLARLAQVPARGRLELDLVGLVAGDQLLGSAPRRSALSPRSCSATSSANAGSVLICSSTACGDRVSTSMPSGDGSSRRGRLQRRRVGATARPRRRRCARRRRSWRRCG